MPAYDPFARGPFPVGVRTFVLSDRERGDRILPVEAWYPATDAHAGQDVGADSRDHYSLVPGLPAVSQDAARDAAPRPERHPLVAFSHGYGGHRRQSTFLCTHLASHGYVVAAVDHTGNTVLDVLQAVIAVQSGRARPDPRGALESAVAARPCDVVFMIDELLRGELGPLIDAERVGMSGHSFGGWTTLVTTARDRRIRAALPLAPAGGASPLSVTVLREALDLAWGRDVPTLFLVAERDTLLPLAGMYELLARTPATKKMVVLENADHMHFCDRVEEVHELFRTMPQDGIFDGIRGAIPPIRDLCPGEHAYLSLRGLALAHMDAHLKADEAAAQFLGSDLRGVLAGRGVAVSVV